MNWDMNWDMNIDYFIILLESELDRVDHVNNTIKSIIHDINIRNAIDGRKLTNNQITSLISEGYLYPNYKVNPRLQIPFKKGQIGCALSHIKLWESIANNGNNKDSDYFVIMEDDIILFNNFKLLIKSIIDELPDDFDYCNLYRHPKFRNKNELENQELKIKNKFTITKCFPTWGTVCYLISKKGAEKFINLCKPIFNTIDEMIIEIITKEKTNISAYTTSLQLTDTCGTIDSDPNPKSKLASTIWESDYF
tara:strand:+ start:1458 stop:2210 length:753 start_codon:yes stop_codon:yes gene_type:complete